MREFIIRWEYEGNTSKITVGEYRFGIFMPIKRYWGDPKIILKEILEEIEKSK